MSIAIGLTFCSKAVDRVWWLIWEPLLQGRLHTNTSTKHDKHKHIPHAWEPWGT